MASDEELRKVAEDVRALARSLTRDLRQAADTARGTGRPPHEAVRDGLRNFADEARQVGRGWRRGYGSRRRGYWWYGWHYPPHGSGPDGTGPEGSGPDGGGRGGGPAGGAPSGPAWRYGLWGPDPRRRHPRRRRPPLPPLRRRWDATTVLGGLAVVLGLAWLLGAIGVLQVPAESAIALALMLLGAALIVTARTDWSLSRHSWPVWMGAAMVVVLIGTSTTFGIGGTLRHVSFGTMNRTAVAGQTVYGGFGKLTVSLPVTTAHATFTVASVAGQTIIDVPTQDKTIRVDAKVLAGQICVNGESQSSGGGAEVNQTFGPTSSPGAEPDVTIDVHQAFGQITIGSSNCR